jgi:micrococcal nuclease
MNDQTKSLIIAGIVFIALGFLMYFVIILFKLPINTDTQEQTFLVVNIIDGDTFEIATGEQVRLICVDTPERGEAGYTNASNFLSKLILNKEVRLEKDVDDKDDYGRLLRYVYVNTSEQDEKEVFVNKELVSQGYANVFRYGNDTKKCDEINRGME